MTTSSTEVTDASEQTPLVAADQSNDSDVYHTDPECYALSNIKSLRRASDAEINAYGLSLCTICEKGIGFRSNNTRRTTCPKCGEKTGNLPRHLRACDGGDDE